MDQYLLIVHTGHPNDCPNQVIRRVPCLHLAFATSWSEHLTQEKNQGLSSSWHVFDKTHGEEEEEDSKRCWVKQVKLLMESRAHMTSLADNIHGLADQLPGSDSFMLNVVWISSSEDVTIESHIQLLGALKRLHDWHHAHIRLVPSSSDRKDNESTSLVTTVAEYHMGLLTRLTCTRTLLPLKPSKERSTQEWTDKFKNKPSDTAAPPVEVKGVLHDLHMLVAGDGEGGCMAHVLYPPAQFNGAVLHRLATTDNRLLEDKKLDLTPVENILRQLPDLTSGLVGMERDLLQLQVYALKMWTDEKTAAGQPPQLTYQEIVSVLSAVKEEYLKKKLGATDMARTHLSGKGLDFTNIKCASELDLDSNMWSEKQALINRETMEEIEKSMKRQKSVDILLGGLQPPKRMDNEIKLDAEEFIKHFLSNGMAAKDNLTPLQLPKKGKLRHQTKQPHNVEPEQMKATSFSEAVKTDLPGIEYCLDSKQAEDQDARISLIQSRYVSHETSSTCTVDKASSPATMKLWQVVDEALTQNGVGKSHKKYKACCTRLFEICKMFLKDLKNSHKLEDHMKRLAEQNVKQVVGFYIE
uniref:Uncharacterized protein n=1 Tax=Branchiostoma floridae TaxID=7739 RepID=C3XTY8_BRAFL|eukprot:XP_002612353.1 hypothetical protein BRAFLDRAFT_80012 [Branchiostoma floridae]